MDPVMDDRMGSSEQNCLELVDMKHLKALCMIDTKKKS